jgi:hypothetical protein
MLYTLPMISDFVTRRWLENLHSTIYTIPMVYGQEITTWLFNGSIYLVTYPMRFHRQCEHHTHPEALSCALWVQLSQLHPHYPTVQSSQLHRTSQRFAIAASPHSQLVCQDYPLPHTASGHTHICSHSCSVFMDDRSINQSLDLCMITSHMLPTSHRIKPWTIGVTPTSSIPIISNHILHTNRIKNHNDRQRQGDTSEIYGHNLYLNSDQDMLD